MTKLISAARSFWASRKNDEQGANLTEYGLLITLIALLGFGAVQAFGLSVEPLFEAGAAAFP